MIKENKVKLILTSIITLLPIVFGLVFWDKLPQQMPIHWGFDGEADNWSTPAFAVFALPLFLLVIHWICILITTRDNKKKNSKMLAIVLWICPLVSIFANGMIYTVSLGINVDVMFVTSLVLGLLFIIIGNYLPKCQQNRTIGIRIKWTLENEENWNATHRFAGKIWVMGGLSLIVFTFLPGFMTPDLRNLIIILLVFVPFLYSYQYHKKQGDE